MTVKELASTATMLAAERIRDAALREQAEVEEITLTAERQAGRRLQDKLRIDDSVVKTTDLVDANLQGKDLVISPQLLEKAIPLSRQAAATTRQARTTIGDILTGASDRLLVITGPCSIHNADEALEYAAKVSEWRKTYGADLEIIMRAYFEKPRTELGWKGLVYDPRLDGSDDINLGLTLGRLTALRITEMGVPIAMERLKALTPQYANGLVAYDAIGARNTTNQGSREYASGTSSPVGFKNTPDGSVVDAVSAVVSANNPHSFLGISLSGMPANIRTNGNPLAHIILRGGKEGPNYAAVHVAEAVKQLRQKGLLEAVAIDASHANSGKQASRQIHAVTDITEQLASGQVAIKAVMLESNLVHGRQDVQPGGSLKHGVSITDECVGLDETEDMLQLLAQGVVGRRHAVLART